MSEPEIARRCLSCGVSVRQMALFCPQCGHPLNHGAMDQSETPEAEQDQRGHDALLTQPLINAEASKILETEPLISKSDRRDTMIDLGVPHREEPPRPAVQQGPLGRVEKIKKVSSVVLDQAAYDPSLRFLLVAAILFVIFLVLMILSKVIG